MLHKNEDFLSTTEEVSSKVQALPKVNAEVYGLFLEYLEALMAPYTSPSGKADYDFYHKMMPIAASLTQSAAILAASATED